MATMSSFRSLASDMPPPPSLVDSMEVDVEDSLVIDHDAPTEKTDADFFNGERGARSVLPPWLALTRACSSSQISRTTLTTMTSMLEGNRPGRFAWAHHTCHSPSFGFGSTEDSATSHLGPRLHRRHSASIPPSRPKLARVVPTGTPVTTHAHLRACASMSPRTGPQVYK